MSELRQFARSLRDALSSFDPATWSGEDCAALAEELAATANACAAGSARAAARAASCGAHRRRGFTDGADWLGRLSGTSTGAARAAFDTVVAAESCPLTKDALIAGELSLAQAHEITLTEAAAPGGEHDLLAVARNGSLGALKDRARSRRLSAIDPEHLHAEQHARREVRHWRDRLGMVCFRGALPPEVGTPFVNRLAAETDRVRRAAGRDRSETHDAYAADAFARLVRGGGRGKAATADLVIVCDIRAYSRGHANPGEVCHIVGGGPIPVSLARELAEDAFVKAVLHDGTRIDTVAHFGRYRSAWLRTALEIGAPPEFDGVKCADAGCDRQYHLEWDHVDPCANDGLTSYENLAARCGPHHREKTERDRKAGLLGSSRSARESGRAPP